MRIPAAVDQARSLSQAERGANPVICIRNASKVFPGSKGTGGAFTALADVSLDVQSGSVVCLVGPSGCGKSTLLNMVAGLTKPTLGSVLYDGKEVNGVNTRVGYITQRDNLLPWATVEKNTALALALRHVPLAQRKERVREVLELVGLEGFAQHYPGQLSGGMRKRVTLARSFIYEPATLLADEPFAALDAQLKVHLQSALLRLRERIQQTVLFVTHDLDEAVAVGDRVVVFGTKPGRIVHEETIALPRPRNVLRLRSDPAFVKLVAGLWRHLGAVAQEPGEEGAG